MGSIVSSNANLYFVTAPTIVSQGPLPKNQTALYQSSLTLQASASAPGQNDGFPLSYQWQFDGTNIAGATSASYTFTAITSGTYSLIVSNAVGSVTIVWQINVIFPGGVAGWGGYDYGASAIPAGTNFAVIAAGESHSVGVLDNGSVVQWGYDWGEVPLNLTNAVAVAASSVHSIALRNDGTVTTWGVSNFIANTVPPGLSGVKAVAAGWYHNVALLTNGIVTAWGDDYLGQTNVPADLTNVTAISACAYHNLALKNDGAVEGWGYNFNDSMTSPPAGLSNVVAICTGYQDSMALKADGTVVVWGDNSAGQTNVPAGLNNVMAVAAGAFHCAALKNDGTVVCWGDNSEGQTNVPASLGNVKLLGASVYHTIAAVFSPLVQYPVDVTKDVLLIYNSNSTNSIAVKDYYLAHRPMITGANVLGVACDVGEFTTSNNCEAQIIAPLLNWLTNNPTKHPEYVILFYDIPMRLWTPASCGTNSYTEYGSMNYRLFRIYPGWKPFVNNINQGGVADCEAYVDKLAYIGTNYSPGKLIISASAGVYGNTNYYFDDSAAPPYSGGGFGTLAKNGVLANDPTASVIFTNGNDYGTNLAIHILKGTNVCGYLCWGEHSALWIYYATNNSVIWSGNSSWWIIQTIESFNGHRIPCTQGNFIEWFSSNAFGGTNYSNTPVGAVSHTEEPYGPGVNDSGIYFGLWDSGKNFAICAWNSRQTTFFQAVGDPPN